MDIVVKIGFWKRAVAIFIDFILLKSAVNISLFPLKRNLDFGQLRLFDALTGVNSQQAKELTFYLILYCLVGLILSLIYFTYFHGSTGQTPGKSFLRMKVIQVSGDPINYKIAFIRWLGYFVSEIAMCLGFFWVAFDKNKQGWHDKIAGTYVVKKGRTL